MRQLFQGILATVLCVITGTLPASVDDKPADGIKHSSEPVRLGTARFLNLGRVFSLAYTRDGKLLASGAWDGSIRIWDLEARKERKQFQAHSGAVNSLAFSLDGKLLVSGGRESGVCLWKLATGGLIRRMGASKETAVAVSFSPDGKQVAAITRGAFHLWDTAGKELWRQGGDRIHRRFALLGSTGLASVSIKPVKRFHDQLVPDANGRLDLTMWDLHSRKERGPSRQLQTVAMTSTRSWPNLYAPVAFSSAGKSLAFLKSHSYATGDSDIQSLDVDAQRLGRPFTVKQDISFLCLSPDGRMLATVGIPGQQAGRAANYILIWEIATGRERCRFRCPDEGNVCVAFSPNHRTLVSGSLDTTILLWDLIGHEVKHGKGATIPMTAKQVENLWNVLKGDDAAGAYRAIWSLARSPKESLPFLSKQLRPVVAADPERIKQLIPDLADKRFEVRDRAYRKLADYRELAEPALQQALAKENVLEIRRRIQHLLENLRALSAMQMQEMRAIEAVERMQTPEAEKLLQTLAGGAPAARLTREARASLERMRESQ